MSRPDSPEISIVTTLYNSSSHLREFYQRMTKVAEESYESHELILVNDGSVDDSLVIALELQKEDPRLKIIDLTRNFGQHEALMAGIRTTCGDMIMLIACDLEEKPEWLPTFKEELTKQKADVVYGVHKKKGEGFFKKQSSLLFYRVFNWLSSVKLTRNIILFRLMKSAYVKSLLQFQETVLFLPGIMELAGHKQSPLYVDKSYKGSSEYRLKSLLYMAIDAITSFSTRPLTLLMLTGFLALGLSFLAVLATTVLYFNGNQLPFGTLFIIYSIWSGVGLLLSGLGIVGLYASRALIEAKRRPQVLVKQIYIHKED